MPRRTPERRAYSFPARRISEAPSVIALPQSVDVEAAAAISTQFLVTSKFNMARQHFSLQCILYCIQLL